MLGPVEYGMVRLQISQPAERNRGSRLPADSSHQSWQDAFVDSVGGYQIQMGNLLAQDSRELHGMRLLYGEEIEGLR